MLAAACILAPRAASAEVTTIKRHPSLLITPAGIERARKRLREDAWAKPILDRLVRQAEALDKEPLPVFEKAWWEEAAKKRWQDIYPEANHHTMFAVAGPVQKAYDSALAYAATGETRYAGLVRKVLLHYTGYEFFAVHPDCGLNWSVWCMPALYAYDIVYDTLSEQDRARIDDFFARALAAVKKDDEWWIRDMMGGLYNNHFAWHKLFIGSYGLFYGKPDLVDYAITSDQGVRDLIENGSRDDGLWLEGSLNYHFTALVALVQFAAELANQGNPLDLWNNRFANGRCLKDLATGPIQVLFPDETIPTIGDTYARRLKLGDVEWYYAAYDAYRLTEIAWLLRDREKIPAEALFLEHLPKGDPVSPAMATRLWPEHGYIALRTQEGRDYWKGDGFSAFLSCDSDGIHSHHDKFGLMVFARGAHVAVDAEARASAEHAFSSRIQNELNHATLCHNTVMVDGKNHNSIAKKLELIEFINAPELKLATIADTRGLVYAGVRMMRTVAATDTFVLDVFQVASDEEHTYDYLFHTCSDDDGLAAGDGFVPIDLGGEVPWKWLRNARRRPVEGDWEVTARQKELTTRLTMLGEPATDLITCEFPKDDKFAKPPIPMLIARRRAKSTVFAAVLQAERGPLPYTRIFLSEGRRGLMRVRVEARGISREFNIRKLD